MLLPSRMAKNEPDYPLSDRLLGGRKEARTPKRHADGCHAMTLDIRMEMEEDVYWASIDKNRPDSPDTPAIMVFYVVHSSAGGRIRCLVLLEPAGYAASPRRLP